MISATELANYFKGYVESLEDAAILLSGVIDKLKINIGFDEKNQVLKEIYSLVCMEHVKKNEMLYFEKGR